MTKKSNEQKAKAALSSHQSTTRYIQAYQDTLVQWTDEEGRIQIGTYTEFLASRQ